MCKHCTAGHFRGPLFEYVDPIIYAHDHELVEQQRKHDFPHVKPQDMPLADENPLDGPDAEWDRN